MVAKSSNQPRAFFIPDVCPLGSSTLIFLHVSERYFFQQTVANSPKNEIGIVEISQNDQNLGFLWKNRCVFSKRNLEIFENC